MRLERSAKGELMVMSSTGGETGSCNSRLNAEVYVWNRTEQLGETFDSSMGFALPKGAIVSPVLPGFPWKSGKLLHQSNGVAFYLSVGIL